MPKKRPDREEELASIIEIVRKSPAGARRSDIASALKDVPQRTLQFWLRSLVDGGRLIQESRGPAARYRIAIPVEADAKRTEAHKEADEKPAEVEIPISGESKQIREYLQQPVGARKHVGYNRQFLDDYRPNTTFYLSPAERTHLAEVGTTKTGVEPAGTYAKQILSRLLIDLSWNSSRLEGNTYSLLDTRRLIEFGEEAQDGNRLEAQMILNHKDAIEFLVSEADEIGFNRHTILNLHGILAQNLLAERYLAVRQSLGEPDPFRQRYRQGLRQLEGDVVRGRLDRKDAAAFISDWINKNVTEGERHTFREMVESDLLGLHEGNFARLQIRPSEFKAWQIAWENKELTFPVPDERYDKSRESVVFWGQDRAQRVRCAISREALDDHFQGDNKDKLDVFRTNRQRIEEIARTKYLAGQIEPNGSVEIRTADI